VTQSPGNQPREKIRKLPASGSLSPGGGNLKTVRGNSWQRIK
jgi:hypothetical protein